MTSPAPHPSITLRPARDADWDAIRALLEANALPLAGAREHLAHFVVADRDGAVLGCAAIERHGDAALLRSVAVAPASQASTSTPRPSSSAHSPSASTVLYALVAA